MSLHIATVSAPAVCSTLQTLILHRAYLLKRPVLCSGALLLRLLDAYAVRYGEMLDGRSEQLPTSELAGGARIRHIFQDIFVEGVGQLNPSK